MFEKIDKNVHQSGSTGPICNNVGDIVLQCYGNNGYFNAQFISFCFNLQQNYDITQLVDCISLMEDIKGDLDLNKPIYPDSRKYDGLKELLTKIKQP